MTTEGIVMDTSATHGLTQEEAEDMANVNQNASPLLNLAAELREAIFIDVLEGHRINVETAFGTALPKLTYREPPSGPRAGAFHRIFLEDYQQMFGVLTPLTRTSRQLRSETVYLSFSTHTFCFRLPDLKELIPLLPEVGRKWLMKMRLIISPSPDGADPAGLPEWYVALNRLFRLKAVDVSYSGMTCDPNPAATLAVIKARIRRHGGSKVEVTDDN
ncbi:hypothetical protein HBI56_161010 [Parastagonospora nodorum]|nr:hypothetical protein HBI10_185760 [Parastagonospora nodorum]KAH4014362.1 hypothetical protein HBI13_173260 [Parastagonospora nodorum]KAH4206864.1 hypothetical protein HBI95_121700 [Parastagonospora nodorum]KAH4287333.1 hypothetical protein HBI02_217340 [Parastagonospora nodorum]KAH4292224.1 hypothetical protein HBI01_183110 [Parastagonospora nodorum]